MMDIETETENVSFDLLSAREFLNAQTLMEARAAELKTACENHSKMILGKMKKVNNIKLKDFMKTYTLSEATKEYVREEFEYFNNYIMIIQKAVSNELAGIMKGWQEEKDKENKPTPTVQPSGTESRVFEMEYNPMNNYKKSEWNEYRLTMKSIWIQYIDWKRRIDNHFNHVERLSTHQFDRRVLRLKDALDVQWIHYIECEIAANHVRDWDQLEEAIIKRMDEIFPVMKRMTTAMNLKQDNGECLIPFMSRLEIAQDSRDWDNWPEERKKAADLFMRITDDKLKDILMEKANNDVEKFTVKFMTEQYQKMKAGSRESLEPVKDYGTIDEGVGSIVKSNKSNNNSNNNKSGRVAKATDGKEKKDRNKCKDCGHFHGKSECRKGKKRGDPCQYSVSIYVPVEKQSSHEEAACKYKNWTWEWKKKDVPSFQPPWLPFLSFSGGSPVCPTPCCWNSALVQ